MQQPPTAPDAYTSQRWEESRRRVRMMTGTWTSDLRAAMERLAGRLRAMAWGDADTTRNLPRSVVNQLSKLYDRPPIVMHDDEDARLALEIALRQAGLWQLAQENQRMTVACRESVMRIDVVRDGDLLVRPVTPDLVWADAHEDAPDVPIELREWRPRSVDGSTVWTVDVLDIRDPDQPRYDITDERGNSIAEKLGVDTSWPDFWRYADGRPFIPAVLYHARRTGRLFDAWSGKELFDGGLRLGVLLSYWGHLVRSCSWPQRYVINAIIPGLLPTADENRPGPQWIPTDPSTLLRMTPERPDAPVTVGQWEAGADPVAVLEAIDKYEAKLASDFDITPTDIERATGDARSGYAIALTKDGQRSAQRGYEPQFQRGDSELLGKVAALLNRAVQANLPETGWEVEYQGIPLSLDEQQQQFAQLQKMLEADIISRVDLRMKQFGESREAARRALLLVDRERIEFRD